MEEKKQQDDESKPRQVSAERSSAEVEKAKKEEADKAKAAKVRRKKKERAIGIGVGVGILCIVAGVKIAGGVRKRKKRNYSKKMGRPKLFQEAVDIARNGQGMQVMQLQRQAAQEQQDEQPEQQQRQRQLAAPQMPSGLRPNPLSDGRIVKTYHLVETEQ